MKRTTLRNMKCGIIMTVVILMISVVPVTAQSVTAQDEAPERSRDGDEAQRRKGIKGVWLVTITPRNCTTGDPIPTAAFESLFTFHRDGTMLVSFRNNSLVLERTAAHGLWRRDRGWRDYSFKFVHLRRNLTTGLLAGKRPTAIRSCTALTEFRERPAVPTLSERGLSWSHSVVEGVASGRAFGDRFLK